MCGEIKKPGMPGFLLPAIPTRLFILSPGQRSFRRTQAPNLFRISQQRTINLKSVPSLQHMGLRSGDGLGENPQRASRQIQLGELQPKPRVEYD